MYIHEAVKNALDEDCYVTSPEFKGFCKFKPTNSMWGCIGYLEKDKNSIVPRWQPTADELMRDDYIVVP